jgi:hypothetical protein
MLGALQKAGKVGQLAAATFGVLVVVRRELAVLAIQRPDMAQVVFVVRMLGVPQRAGKVGQLAVDTAFGALAAPPDHEPPLCAMWDARSASKIDRHLKSPNRIADKTCRPPISPSEVFNKPFRETLINACC